MAVALQRDHLGGDQKLYTRVQTSKQRDHRTIRRRSRGGSCCWAWQLQCHEARRAVSCSTVQEHAFASLQHCLEAATPGLPMTGHLWNARERQMPCRGQMRRTAPRMQWTGSDGPTCLWRNRGGTDTCRLEGMVPKLEEAEGPASVQTANGLGAECHVARWCNAAAAYQCSHGHT